MRHRDERHAGLREVACDRCGAMVGVAKFSPQHTSVQWSAQAADTCAEFAGREAGGAPRARVPGCASLAETIDRAVRDGVLKVGIPGGEDAVRGMP